MELEAQAIRVGKSFGSGTNFMLSRYKLYIGKQDCWSWTLDPNGIYSVKFGYSQLLLQYHNGELPKPEWVKEIWKRWVPFKTCAFIWKVVQNRIPVYSNLRARGLYGMWISQWAAKCVILGMTRQ